MSSAFYSSTCIATRELLFCSKAMPMGNRESRPFGDRNLAEIRANGAIRHQSPLCWTEHILPFSKEKRLYSAWKEGIRLLRNSNITCSPGKQYTHLIKAVVTLEPKCLTPLKSGTLSLSNLQNGYTSDSQVFQSSNEGSPEMDRRESLRRMKISKANKGNVPWNKGRKHSAETIQRIRERTRIAMQDPKVKMKLVNLGHAQSEETRIKIAVGVRDGWQRHRNRLMAQESCLFEWMDTIAEASRKGYVDDEKELQWDSYEVLDKQLSQEWLERNERRKTASRLNGGRKAPKSLEQRRRISESISAKWADPEYRNRVSAALSEYYGARVGAQKEPRSRRTKQNPNTEKSKEVEGMYKESKSFTRITRRRKRNVAPLYKDPMASSKFEMIKKVREGRAAMETKRKEATERAKLLIAKAEKAAKVLEVVALKSSLAQASLLETRKLIAEATRSIESIDGGRFRSHDTGDQKNRALLDNRSPNGYHLSSIDCKYENIDFDKFSLENALNVNHPSHTSNRAKDIGYLPPPLQLHDPKEEESELRVEESYKTSANKTKKWFCGRLVEREKD